MGIRRVYFLVLICISFSLSARQVFRGENIWKLQKQVTEASCDATITQDDVPLTISQSGVYCLAESLNSNIDTVITITATENVVLDLNGHEIMSRIPSSDQVAACSSVLVSEGAAAFLSCLGVGVLVNNSSNIVVRNGFIDKGFSCIAAVDCNDVFLKNLTVSQSKNDNIRIESSGGIIIDTCVSSLAGSKGIDFVKSSTCIVMNSVIKASQGDEIVIDTDVSHCCVRNCKVFANNDGIVVQGTECEAVGNSVIGVDPSGDTGINNSGNGSRIFNNLVHNFTTNYFGVDVNTIELVPTTSTGYWANVSQ